MLALVFAAALVAVNQRRMAGFSTIGALARSTWGSTTGRGRVGDDVHISIEALAVTQ